MFLAALSVSASAQNDETAALQRAIDQLPPGGVLDGANRTCTVRTLRLKSRMTLQNFRFRTLPTREPLTAPVTIDGLRAEIRDVTVRNVHVHGNRAGQTNLVSPEDGGRDGFRIVGHARNIWLLNCSAEYCATDGLKIFSGDPRSGDDRRLNFDNIVVSGCRFHWNRRMGASVDSIRNSLFLDCEFHSNGLDIEGGKTEGARGARDRGVIYGAGVDVEGYGIGCGVDGLSFLRCSALGNARHGIQFWDIADPAGPNFLTRRNIRIEASKLDGGVSPAHGRQALEFSLPPKLRSGPPMYENVVVQNTEVDGTIVLHSVRRAEIVGGTVRSPYPGFWGIAEFQSSDVRVSAVAAGSKVFVQR